VPQRGRELLRASAAHSGADGTSVVPALHVRGSVQRNTPSRSTQDVPRQHSQSPLSGLHEAPSRPQQRRQENPSHSGRVSSCTFWHLISPEPLQHFLRPPHFLRRFRQRFLFFFPAMASKLDAADMPAKAAPTVARSVARRGALLASLREIRSKRFPSTVAPTFRNGLGLDACVSR
jgi:hypothetical protein